MAWLVARRSLGLGLQQECSSLPRMKTHSNGLASVIDAVGSGEVPVSVTLLDRRLVTPSIETGAKSGDC